MKTAATSHIKFPGMNAKEGLAPLLAWWQAAGQVESILWFDCQGDIPPGPYGREEKDLNLPLKVTRQSGVVSQWHRAPQTGRDPEVSSPKDLQGSGKQVCSGLEVYPSLMGLLWLQRLCQFLPMLGEAAA